jgi:hypothetical protein
MGTIRPEFGVPECPTLVAERTVIRAFDFMEIILVQLPDETGKVGVFEYPRKDGFSKFGHILDDEGVTLGTPGYDVHDLRLFKHPVKFFDEVACCTSFTRFLFGIALLALRLAMYFILSGGGWILDGGNSASGGIATG